MGHGVVLALGDYSLASEPTITLGDNCFLSLILEIVKILFGGFIVLIMSKPKDAKDLDALLTYLRQRQHVAVTVVDKG